MGNKYHITVETTIDSDINTIWDKMINTREYGDWNSFIKKITIEKQILLEGTKMKFEVQFKNGKKTTSDEQVKLFKPPHNNQGTIEAEWIYDFTGFLHNIGMVRASRTQKLTQLENGSVHYYTCEKFSGWGKIFLPLKNVKAGFDTHAADLKKHCEKL